MAQSDRDEIVSIDRERERAVAALSRQFELDNLSMEELERRMTDVYRARSVQALREIINTLPSEPDASPKAVAVIDDAYPLDSDRIVSIMAETKRRGLWRPPRRLDVWCIMSDTRLDLTEAELNAGVTEIHLRAVMASVRIIVPPGVRVVVQPGAFMSSVDDEFPDQPPLGSGAPVIRVTGPVVMSELKIRVRRREVVEG